jgi:hypothetical protein
MIMIHVDPMRSADPKVLAPDYYSRTTVQRIVMIVTT